MRVRVVGVQGQRRQCQVLADRTQASREVSCVPRHQMWRLQRGAQRSLIDHTAIYGIPSGPRPGGHGVGADRHRATHPTCQASPHRPMSDKNNNLKSRDIY